MKRYVVVNKAIGETPLSALKAWKERHPMYRTIPATYAGRLDPMASGKLLVLLGDECKRKEHYTGLDKEYVVEVLLDIDTDTGDLLGLPTYAQMETTPDTGAIQTALKSVCGAHTVPYPVFSSKTVQGKPLFQYALEGTLDTISIPTHVERVYAITLENSYRISTEELQQRIATLLSKAPRALEPSYALGADFRQDEVRTVWESVLQSAPHREFTVLTLRVACGSGTYMRTLASRLGVALQTSALALSIHRSKIGRYRSVGSCSFFLPSF